MYHVLTQHLSRTLLLEMRRFWSFSPQYPDMVKNIQGKFSFRERPQQGIILQNISGSAVPLSPDNFMGTVNSYVTLASVNSHPGMFLEWVREDAKAIQRNGGVFPSLPGVYYIQIDEVFKDRFTFRIGPLLEVINEPLMMVNETTARLGRGRALEGSVRLYLAPGDILLKEGVNYTVDAENGLIYLLHPLAAGDCLYADYRYPATDVDSPSVREGDEPWTGLYNRALCEPLPGVVLAFGRRVAPGDLMAVVINSRRDFASLEFGGRWDSSVDIEVFARDIYEQRDILDQTLGYLWGVLRPRLSTRGIEMSNLSNGGESEEPYNDVADEYYYSASISFSLQSDWSLQSPLTRSILRAEPGLVYPESGDFVPQEVLAQLSSDTYTQLESSMRAVESLGMGLRAYGNPLRGLGRESIL